MSESGKPFSGYVTCSAISGVRPFGVTPSYRDGERLADRIQGNKKAAPKGTAHARESAARILLALFTRALTMAPRGHPRLGRDRVTGSLSLYLVMGRVLLPLRSQVRHLHQQIEPQSHDHQHYRYKQSLYLFLRLVLSLLML